MYDEPIDECVASFLEDARALFLAAGTPEPDDALAALFVEGLANDKGDRLVTAGSNAYGSARLQMAGLPNWTRRTTTMTKELLRQAGVKAAAAVLAAVVALGALGAAGAVKVPTEMIGASGELTGVDCDEPDASGECPEDASLDDGTDVVGVLTDGDGEAADWTGVASPEDCAGANHGCWVSLAAHNKAGHTCDTHGRYVSQVAKNKGDEAQYYFDTDCDGELTGDELTAYEDFLEATSTAADVGSEEVVITQESAPEACVDANHGCWVSLAAHNKAGHTCDTHGRYVSQVAKNKGDEAQYYFDTDCDGELTGDELTAHEDFLEATSTASSSNAVSSADEEPGDHPGKGRNKAKTTGKGKGHGRR